MTDGKAGATPQDCGRYRDGLVAGLYLQVSDRGANHGSYDSNSTVSERMMGLGPAAVFTLKEARARAIWPVSNCGRHRSLVGQAGGQGRSQARRRKDDYICRGRPELRRSK